MSFASRNLPAFILFLLLGIGVAVVFVLFSNSLHTLQSNIQHDFDQVNDRIHMVESRQSSFQQQIQTLTKLVIQSLNATDEYINNITNTVSEAKDVIDQDIATVNEMTDSQNSLLAAQFAGMFTILVILVSGYHLSQHLRHMHSPVVQRKIMAVLWMTPLYSVTSWLSLVFPSWEAYLAVVREFYESYCVYTFLSFLISVLGRGDRWAVVELLEREADQLSPPDKCKCCCKKGSIKRLWLGCVNGCGKRRRVPNNESNDRVAVSPTNSNSRTDVLQNESATRNSSLAPGGLRDENNLSDARVKAESVLDQCQMYAMQFVLLRPITAIGWLVSNKLVVPKDFLDYTAPQFYIVIITNASIFFAFRGLVKFYHATRTYLEWCNPWPKFLCIKGVVFMTFWQKMAITIIVQILYADKFDSRDEAMEFVKSAQNFLICIEMLFAATAHCFVFSPDEWAEGYREREERRRKRQPSDVHFGDGVALRDFIEDVKTVMASSKRKKKRKKGSTGLATDQALSPSSTISRDDDDETADDSEGRLRRESTITLDSVDAERGLERLKPGDDVMDDQIDQEFSIGEEYEGDLASPLPSPEKYASRLTSPSKAGPRRRLDTDDSNCSDAGDYGGSWSRIEKYINEHGTSDSRNQRSSTITQTKEIV